MLQHPNRAVRQCSRYHSTAAAGPVVSVRLQPKNVCEQSPSEKGHVGEVFCPSNIANIFVPRNKNRDKKTLSWAADGGT
jgi:hypothetical protein